MADARGYGRFLFEGLGTVHHDFRRHRRRKRYQVLSRGTALHFTLYPDRLLPLASHGGIVTLRETEFHGVSNFWAAVQGKVEWKRGALPIPPEIVKS